MRAARLHEYETGRLVVGEIDDPVPSDPFDVIVRVGGAGVCRTDLHILEGLWADWVPAPPFTPGHETAGWVEAVGSGVSTVAVGDTVIVHTFMTCGLCRPCRSGIDQHCDRQVAPGITVDGGFAEFLRTTERAVVRVDPSLAPKDIAAMADAGLTAYHAVTKAIGLLHPGSRAVVVGAGGLGLIGVQLLRALTTAEVIVVEPRESAREQALARGAHHALDADDGQVDAVLELTDGRGAEAVFDFIGGFGSTSNALAMTRRPGSTFIVGYGETLSVPTMELIVKEINIVGNTAGTYNDLVDLMRLAAAGLVELPAETYPIEDVNQALADLRDGRLSGRAVLVP
jgi:NAD+-dependent secondary alcohol dehydrogenase Adh1